MEGGGATIEKAEPRAQKTLRCGPWLLLLLVVGLGVALEEPLTLLDDDKLRASLVVTRGACYKLIGLF